MLKLVSAAAVLCWALCIFLRTLASDQAPIGRDTRPNRARSQAPKGLEWRQVRRLGGRVLAVRLQVILC